MIVTDMEIQFIKILSSIWAAIASLSSTVYGKILMIGLFIGSTFAEISGIIHITLILVSIDMVLGLGVTIKVKGVRHILSCRLRDSLLKAFFYLLFIMSLYLVESEIIDGFFVTSKVAFSIVSAIEIWSIAANGLILCPQLVFFRVFKKYLTNEMSKKIGIPEDELSDFLDNKHTTNE